MLKLLMEESVPSVTIPAATMENTSLASYSIAGTCSPTARKSWSAHMGYIMLGLKQFIDLLAVCI